MSSAVQGAIKPENANELNGRIAEQFIPANGQIVVQTFSNNSVVLKEDEFVFKLPPTWVYTIPSSIRRGDLISIYEIDGKIESRLNTGEEVMTVLTEGRKEAIFETTVVYVKDSTNREVMDTNGNERLDGSSQVSAIEIICTREDTQVLEKSILNGKKLVVVYRGELEMKMCTGYPTGVPLGGIGTGMIELLSNGKPGTIITNGNWGYPIIDLEGCFFAIRIEEENGKSYFRLLQSEGYMNFQGASTVRYTGLYPVAKAEYFCVDLPLQMEVTAFSPMVPHDVEKSNYPGAIFIFKFRNMFKEKVKINLFISWENVIGCGGVKVDEPILNRTGNYIIPVKDKKNTGLIFKTSEETKVVYPNSIGEYALLTPLNNQFKYSEYVWNTVNEKEMLLKALSHNTSFGNIDIRGEEGTVHPSGIIGLEFNIEPMEQIEIPVSVSWYMPNHKLFDRNAIISSEEVKKYALEYEKNSLVSTEGNDSKDIDYGHFYQNRFNSAMEVSGEMLENYKQLFETTSELNRYLKATDLPDWLTSKIINDSTPLTANTILTKDGVLATLEASSGMFGSLGTMDQRIVAQAAYQLFYPEINRTELQLFADLQAEDGHIPHFCGNVYESIGNSNVEYGDTQWPDLSCSFIFQCYRDFMSSGDKDFFNSMLPHIYRAYEWLKSADTDNDGVPEGGSTWDVEHHEGLFSYTGTLCLAVLRILERIAFIENNASMQQETKFIFDKAQKSIIENLWNGEYFNKLYNPATGIKSDEVFVGQLAGEWVVRLLGLESILPIDFMKKAIKSIYKYNGNKDLYRMLPIKVTNEGLLIDREYKEHAWPQYTMVFLDCLAIHLGMANEGLDYIKYFNDTICEISRTPWTTTLWYDCRTGLPCWDGVDRYMNCTAAWFILNAITGFHADETEKLIVVGPAFSEAKNMSMPLISTKFWAMLEYSQTVGLTSLAIKFDKLFCEDIELIGLKLRDRCICKTFLLNGEEVDFESEYEKGYTKILFKDHQIQKVSKGDILLVDYFKSL